MIEAVRLYIVMGVSGCGKTTVGEALCARLGIPFLDGDKFHPPENVEKMRGGTPLTDADRWPWLKILAAESVKAADRKGMAVTACSALKRVYRDVLRVEANEPVRFVHLHGPKPVIAARQADRPGHYMPASLLDSQFATLEMPGPDEDAVTVSVDQPIDEMIEEAIKAVGPLPAD